MEIRQSRKIKLPDPIGSFAVLIFSFSSSFVLGGSFEFCHASMPPCFVHRACYNRSPLSD